MENRNAAPRPTSSLAGKDLGDEFVFYDRERDRVHILNGTARSVYLLCDGQRSIVAIGREVAHLFAIDEDRARKDVKELVDGLVRLGVLEC